METQSKQPGTTSRAKAQSPRLLSLALVASLSGCAVQSPRPPLDQGLVDVAAQEYLQMHGSYQPLSTPRELMREPAPPGYFSSRAAESFERWRKVLMNSAIRSEDCIATSTPC